MVLDEEIGKREDRKDGGTSSRYVIDSVNRTRSISSQVTRIPRRGLGEGRGKDTFIYMAPRLGSAKPLTRVYISAVTRC